MLYIESANDFFQLIHSYDEAILIADGNEKYITLEFLKYTNALGRICCLARERVDSFNNIAQKSEYTLPIIPLEYLPHFHKLGLIIVAAPLKFHEQIEQRLTSLGFENVLFLHSNAIEQMQSNINQVVSSGEALIWLTNHLAKKIDALENLITEQNEICAVNTKTFAKYQNRFRGKDIVIVGSGPTLKYYAPPAAKLFTLG